jgi:hypothetical protein
MSELWQTLTEAVDAEAIPRTDERYRLDPAHIDVDLWRLTAAANQAATAVDSTRHTLALREIVQRRRRGPGRRGDPRRDMSAQPDPRPRRERR